MRLDLALIRLHPGLSRRGARDVIEKGQVDLDGAVVLEAGASVTEGSRIVWDPNRKARSRARASLPILYQDEEVLIVDKPAGLLSVPSSPTAEGEDTARARVEDFVHHLHPARPFVGVVHRLDRGTSGALAFALAPKAHSGLKRLFREHEIGRRYVALVQGAPAGAEGLVDKPIYDGYNRGRRRLAKSSEPSHPALTRFRVKERFSGTTLLEVDLETGRQHQIRLHLAAIGLPIVGDKVYGEDPSPRRLMLHAETLDFTNPVSGIRVHARSPLPVDFLAVLSEARRGELSAGRRRVPRAREVGRGKGYPPGGRAPEAGTKSRRHGPRRTGFSSRPEGGARRGRSRSGPS